MGKKLTHAGLAIAAFVVVAGAFLWMTGALSVGARQGPAKAEDPKAAAEGGPGEKDERAKADGKIEEGDAHGHTSAGQAAEPAAGPARPDIKAIEAKLCEHKIRQIECDECRYELGVVKVQQSVTDALTKTAVVKYGQSGGRLRMTGEVRLDETAVVDVLPIASGKIVEVKARLGQKVTAGQVLAVLHSGDYGEAKAAYLETIATADVAAKENERQAAVAGALEKMIAWMDKGQAPAEGAKTPLGEWRSKLVGASARLQQAKVVCQREKSLVAKQASSQAELETAERELQTAQADYAALLEEVQLNLGLDRLKAANSARLAEAKLNATEQRLHLFGLDDTAIRALPQGKENGTFAQLEIKAPRAGTITAQNAVAGKFVETTHSLFTVADTSNVWVWCDLYERDLGALHGYLAAGNTPKAVVKVAAFPDAFAGAVDHVGSAVEETTRTIKVRVQVRNDLGKLKPGMFAAVEVDLPAGKAVAVVPRTAVLSDEGRYFAFQHWKGDLWLKRDVVPGRAYDDVIEVVGLEEGLKVVAAGAFLFKSDILRAKMGAGCAD